MPSFGSYEAHREVAGAGFCARWEASLSASSSSPSMRNAKPFGDRFVATAVGPSVIVPWLPRAGLDEEARRLVGAARDQAQLVGAGAKRWSIIADFGLMDDGRGAFVVRPTLPWTIERMVLAQYVFTSVELRGIVLGIVDGLLELERNSARQWGNLSSSTVMLTSGPGDSRLGDGTAVSLTELESRERLGTDAYVADLRALGRLVYEMVLHKRPPLKAVNGWSATWNDGWESIGDGRWWFDFANRLMSAGTAMGEGGTPPTLAAVRQQVLEHRAHRPIPKRQLMIAGGVVAFALLAGGTHLALRTPERNVIVLTADQLEEKARLAKWQSLVERWRLWFGELHAARGQVAEVASKSPSTSTIRAISDLLNDPTVRDPRDISGAGTSASLLDLRDSPGDAIQGEKIIAAAATLDKIEEMRQLLSEWPELARLRETASQWSSRGWGKATEPLHAAPETLSASIPAVVVRDSNSEGSASLAQPEKAGAIVPAVLGAQRAIADALKIEAIWESLFKSAEASKASGDSVLAKLGDIAKSETDRAIANETMGQPSVDAIAAKLVEIDREARAALAFERGEVEGWDKAGFRESERLKEIAAGELSIAQIAAWRAEAAKPEYAKVDAPDPRIDALAKMKDAMASLASGSERLDSLAKAERELTMSPAEFQERLARIKTEASTLEATAWSNRNRSRAERMSRELVQNISALQRDTADALATAVLSVNDAIGRENREEFSSPVLKDLWIRTLDGAKSGTGKREVFSRIRSTREALQALDSQLPAEIPLPPEVSNANDGAWARAVASARDRIFKEAIGSGSIDVPVAAAKYAAWRVQAEGYFLLAREAQKMLDRGLELVGPDRNQGLVEVVARMDATPNAKEFAPVLPRVTSEIAEIQRIGNSNDPSMMVKAIANGTEAPVAIAAWGRLAEIGWPANAAEFAKAAEIISRTLPAVIENGIDPQTREVVLGHTADRAKAMWITFANSRPGPDREGIDAAFANAGLFGISSADQAGLSGNTRYNALLWMLARESEEYSKKQAELGIGAGSAATALAAQTQVAGDFLRRLREGAASFGVAGSTGVAPVQEALRVIADRDAKPAFDPLKSGPAAVLGPNGQPLWKGTKDGDTIIYALDLPPGRLAPGQPPVKIEFRPVKIVGPGGPIATYVSTHEVSVGMLMGAAEAQRNVGSWDQLKSTIRWWDYDRPDPRKGPATWTWDIRRAKVTLSDRSKETADWLQIQETMQGKPYYAPDLGVIAPPTYDSPMDWISPDGALVAARLMGARLPTIDEWHAAVEDGGGLEKSSDKANRRDKTWTVQFNYIKDLDVSGKEWPHAGIFWPRAMKPMEKQPDGKMLYVNASDDSALTYNDGYLWFASVMRDSQGWSNLVGNVSEIVLDGESEAIASVEPTAEAVKPLVEELTEKWRIVGGSALSAITLRDGKLYEVEAGYEYPSLREARMGYADVGFRLAFSEGGTGRPTEPPAVLAARVLKAAPYLGSSNPAK